MKNCLTNEEVNAIFQYGVNSVIAEKKAASESKSKSNFLGDIGSVMKGSAGLVKDLAIYGTIAGALSGTGYNILKERVVSDSPEDEYNRKVERIVINKKRELEDAIWMKRVRKMRDELAMNYKKMSPEEYANKYKTLVDALNERNA